MKIGIEYLVDEGNIYASTLDSKNKFNWKHSSKLTDEAIESVFKYILHMKTTGDYKETLEFQKTVKKYGKPYKVTITLTPIEQ